MADVDSATYFHHETLFFIDYQFEQLASQGSRYEQVTYFNSNIPYCQLVPCTSV